MSTFQKRSKVKMCCFCTSVGPQITDVFVYKKKFREQLGVQLHHFCISSKSASAGLQTLNMPYLSNLIYWSVCAGAHTGC